jgi:hypothetical protein
MKLLIVVSVCLFGIQFNGYSFQDPKQLYNSEVIKEELKKDAYSVMRYEKVEMEITGPDRLTMHQHQVVTILNEKGRNELMFYVRASKFRVLEDVEVKLYDSKGILVDRFKKKDLSSQNENTEFVEDGTIFYKKLSAGTYPVTIEKDYTVRFNGIFQLPGFFFQVPHQSTEYSGFQVKYPSSMKINYKEFNLKTKAVQQTVGGNEIIEFSVKDQPVIKYEDNSGPWFKEYPRVLLNSNKISFDGYAGNVSSWKEMGLWYNNLVKNTNELSLPHQQDIQKLVAGAASDKEKVKILYDYLQRNFRYVSIQLGIGGLKPFPADFVHEKKYGDCKGLSNYMEACLSAVNIKSYSAWIKSGDEDDYLDSDFANDAFDHQILMVPLQKDTVWLECTSNYNQFGHLGAFTENRYALVLTENGGQLIKTPSGKATDNTLSSNTDVTITPEGGAEVKVGFSSTGEYKYMLVNISRESAENHKKYAVDYFGIMNPDDFQMDFDKKENQPYHCTMHMNVGKIYEFKAGSKIFARPRIYKIWQSKLNQVDKRLYNYYLSHPLIKTDTTTFHLPEGFTVESLPKDKNISFALGKYEARYWVDEKSRTVFSTARLEINTYKIEPALYEQARLFFDQVLDDGNQKIIFKNAN